MLTERDIRDAQTIMEYFFGQEAGNWRVNDRVMEKLAGMLTRERTCSRAMDLIPRPGFVDQTYVRRQLAGTARRIRSGDHSYRICKEAVSYGWKRRIQLASQGL
jgi:hypothetical protein